MHESAPFGIIVHCHLRWDFVWQRPQQIVSRLARLHPVLFLEDAAPLPVGETKPRFVLTHVGDTLTVARPLLHPRTGNADADAETDHENGAAWERLLDTIVAQLKATDPAWENIVHWMYTPSAVGARHRYDPVAVVYDCMDELANFKNASANIKAQEAELMRSADMVFTGGPSMYAARKDIHPKVHLFNSGVDMEHFGLALNTETVVPDDMATLPSPRLLYYGVIDERMGFDNLAAVCDAHPEWSVVMVGPLAKITESDLLRRPNLHYIGQRAYEKLPGYLKGCDVALVPFALSDATKYLSPTKTLEYFAARRPVVSTPIADIVEHYSDAARIAHTPDEFVRECEAALLENNTGRFDAGERFAKANTWNMIVATMDEQLSAAIARKTTV